MSVLKLDEPNLIIGVDIPDYILGFERNQNKLKTLNKSQAICAGYIMWELVKSGTISGLGFFNNDGIIRDPNHTWDLDFGKILGLINNISGCNTPDEYNKVFDEAFEDGTIKDEDALMASKLLGKIATASLLKYEVKAINLNKCQCCGK